MKTRFLVSLLFIISIAVALLIRVPPAAPKPQSISRAQAARRNLLTAQLKQSAKAFRAGDFNSAASLARRGYLDAVTAREPRIAARFLGNLGGCRFALHQYQDALQAYTEARRLAETSGDSVTAATLDINISSIYLQLRQMDAAIESAERATVRLAGAERARRLPSILIHLAGLYADQQRMAEAKVFYRQAIASAADDETCADAWDDLGFEYLGQQQLPQAGRALMEAYRIRKLNHLRGIEYSYRNLGMLRLEEGDARHASRLLDEAVECSRRPGGLRPTWEVYFARGRVRLAQDRLPDALDDLRISARLSHIWRRNVLPDDATRVSTESFVQKVHSALVEAGNKLYFRTHRPELAQETFESAEANRASSLRALLAEPRDWRRNLPPAYWETLQRLESAEVDLVGGRQAPASESSAAARMQRLRGELVQLEFRAGANLDLEIPGLLARTRHTLRPDTAFFVCHLASPDSYLWAVSRERFALYRLPAGPEIGALVSRFVKDIRRQSGPDQDSGARLYRALFGRLDPSFQQKSRWLLALDAQLFDLPFAALVVETGPHGPVFLAQRHSLQIVSSASLLTPPGLAANFTGRFLGVADPVYNVADPRWTGARPRSFLGFFTALAGNSTAGDLQLARLPASAREAAACAAAWHGSLSPVLLEGEAASRRRLQAELNAPPAVLHFATHVAQSGVRNRSGLIVLSLTSAGKHQVLGPVEIATWNLDGALVSLSGCSSGSADVLPGAGLMGLTRACLAAGARAVVASLWPTPDDSGAFFLSFYTHLRASPAAGPAQALQSAQIDMLQSHTFRAHPDYWGAYFVTGNQ